MKQLLPWRCIIENTEGVILCFFNETEIFLYPSPDLYNYKITSLHRCVFSVMPNKFSWTQVKLQKQPKHQWLTGNLLSHIMRSEHFCKLLFNIHIFLILSWIILETIFLFIVTENCADGNINVDNLKRSANFCESSTGLRLCKWM